MIVVHRGPVYNPYEFDAGCGDVGLVVLVQKIPVEYFCSTVGEEPCGRALDRLQHPSDSIVGVARLPCTVGGFQ